ncbi:lasso RiPP family leader peptide-containing protein [Streptomyces triculaminicus]|uniref:Lasso RiPP family leader peptide-containing protein n=1 Tax=Streptomyces triculaminicus TaxID=2816232 RepID=A0A939FKZ0_9ACTN|nr:MULTISPECIES: lasso RiPP family leader peptide-containing protein [Streptomyces]MBO0652458.1 lasso RiPP family leader peptide-containing protein [Streptomyces triculaminicus]
MEQRADDADTTAQDVSDYEPPELIEVGTFAELTLGGGDAGPEALLGMDD